MWAVLPEMFVHGDVDRAGGRAILFVRLTGKVSECNIANGFSQTRFGRPWAKHRFDPDGQLCMISVGGNLEKFPPAPASQLRKNDVVGIELDGVHVFVEDMGSDPVLCVAVFQPCPVLSAIHAVLIHLPKDNLGEKASDGLSDLAVCHY